MLSRHSVVRAGRWRRLWWWCSLCLSACLSARSGWRGRSPSNWEPSQRYRIISSVFLPMDRVLLGTRKLARNERRSILHLFRYAGVGGLIVIGILSAVPGQLRPHVFVVPQLEHFVAYFAA